MFSLVVRRKSRIVRLKTTSHASIMITMVERNSNHCEVHYQSMNLSNGDIYSSVEYIDQEKLHLMIISQSIILQPSKSLTSENDCGNLIPSAGRYGMSNSNTIINLH